MSNQLANIHDRFFKQALSDPELARAFLREHLPQNVASLLGPQQPEMVPGSFVDEELRQHHSDVLFRVQLRSGGDAFAYVLVEHKSVPDPSFRHALIDLAGKDDRALSTEVRLRAYLKALKYGRRADLPKHLNIVLAEARVLSRKDLRRIVTYFDKGPIQIPSGAFDKALQQVDPERTEEIMGWITQPHVEKAKAQGMAQGLAEGKAQGMAEGRAEGEANALLRLLEKRFGTIPTHIKQRIFAADLASIQEWFERAIDAPDLDSVFVPK